MRTSSASFEELAATIRTELTGSDACLCNPRGGQEERLDDENLILARLASWGYFNPYGPTMETLSWIPLANGDRLLALRLNHPLTAVGVVYGLFPADASGDRVAAALLALFRRNGSSDHPLFGGLPSFVVHAGNSPWPEGGSSPTLSAELAKACFREAFSGVAGSAANVRRTCARMREYRLDPWGRAARERDDVFSNPEVLRLLEAIKATNEGRTPAPATEGHHAEPEEDPAQVVALFEEWFDLVTATDHVMAEMSEFENAWEGSIKFASGEWR